ncbi:MAG: hypothetical protein R6W91_04265 [Thermoplasmata archaeon]
MKQPHAPNITNLIGIMLVIVALVSAGGLYFVASEYSKISETLVSTEILLSDMTVIQNNASNKAIISFSIFLNNPADLDIDIYRIEYYLYTGQSPQDSIRTDSYVGAGGSSSGISILSGSTMNEIPLHMTVNGTYMVRFRESINPDNSLYTFISGKLLYRITNYPDVYQELEFAEIFPVVVQYE